MAEYLVTIKAGAYAYVTIEADSQEEAEAVALAQTPTLCAECTGWGQDWELELSDDWDIDETSPTERTDEEAS